MRRIFVISVAAAALLILSCGQKRSVEKDSFFRYEASEGTLASVLDTLTAAVSGWQKEGKMVGAEMLVIRGRDIILHRVFGWADREDSIPMRRNTICRIRSMTKPVVGTAVWILYEQGKLELSDRVAQYLPSFDNPDSDSITVYQLMTHTAGFEQTGFPEGSIYEYPSLEAGVKDLGEKGPQNPPGEQYIYSDGGSSTLARLVAAISGMPCEDFLRENIFEPLNMNDTYCNAPESDSLRRRFSSTYSWQDGQFGKYWDNQQEQELPFFRGSGGIYTTPLDYARFLYAWSNPQDEFLSGKTRERALESTDFNEGYALQWEIYHRNDSLGIAFGHGGSDGTVAISFPDRELLALFFTQTRGTVAVALFEELIFTQLGYQEPPDYREADLTGKQAEKILGVYRMKPWEGRIYRENGKWRIRFNQNQPLDILPLSEEEFVIPDIGVTLKFLYDETGNIYQMNFIRGGNVQEFEKVQQK